MIRICPAILTDSLDELKRELKVYSESFDLVDIDINVANDAFQGKDTVGIEIVLEEAKKFSFLSLNLHLMVEKPLIFLEKIASNFKQINRILVHEEYANQEIIDVIPFENRGVVVTQEIDNTKLEFYNKFSEVQLMTVVPGAQGSIFLPDALNKVKDLKDLGYKGMISVDGGVNVDTARIIRDYDVERVSVGSYFSKSDDVTNELFQLNGVLNRLYPE